MGNRMPWTCTSMAWASCWCCWQVSPPPASPLAPRPRAAQPSLHTLPLFVAEPPGRRRELLHTEVTAVVERVGRLPLPLFPCWGSSASRRVFQGWESDLTAWGILGALCAPSGAQVLGVRAPGQTGPHCFGWKGLLEKGSDKELKGPWFGWCGGFWRASGMRRKQFEGPSGPHPQGRVFPRQVQNLMARAEYLKEQVKVGMPAGRVLPFSACGSLSPVPSCGLAASCPSLPAAACPLHPLAGWLCSASLPVAGCPLYPFCPSLPVAGCPLHPLACLPLPSSSEGPPSLSLSLALMLNCSAAAQCGPVPASGCLSPLRCLYVPQMRESHWAAETLDKEGLSESVRSCESCPGVGPLPRRGKGRGWPWILFLCQRLKMDFPPHFLSTACTLQ